jgi:hypothetical protein
MGIPSRKAIIEWMSTSQLELGDKAATICRQAMEWAEGADPKPTLESFYEDVVYPFHGQGLFVNLDYYRNNRVDVALKIMDVAMETHGVEYVKSNQDDFHTAAGFEYLNTGDTYSPTIIYDLSDGQWRLGTWGGEVEHDERRFGEGADSDEYGWFENPNFIPPGLGGLAQIYGPVTLPAYAVVMRRGPIGYMDIWNELRDRFPDETPADILILLENLAREGAIMDLGGDTFGKW